MSRQKRASAKQVQMSRRDWYAFHFENRQTVKALPPVLYEKYLYAVSMISPPRMTVFGGVEADYPERSAYDISIRFGLDVNLINPWYLTEESWKEFQELWQALPEPVDLYTEACVQIGELSTLSTMPAESEVR